MRLSEILRLVWINIIQNKTKVLLTSLGVIVGSTTIVLVLAIGQGGQADVADQFKNLNAGSIDIASIDAQTAEMEMMARMEDGPPSDGGGPGGSGGGGFSGGGPSGSGGSGGGSRSSGSSRRSSSFSRTSRVRMTESDVEDIATLVPGLEEVTILINGSTTVYGGDLDEEQTSTVVGVLPNYQQVSNLELMYGNFISDDDNTSNNYVAVIGYSLAKDIFTLPSYAYGDYLTIDGKNYEIIGVLEEMGSVSSGISSDDAIFIPYNTAVKYIYGTQTMPTITAVASDVSGVDSAIENIKAVLTENYPKGNFSLTDAGSAMDAATSSANTLAMLLFAVASIVFVVGGIGIMNVLFVSVQERTPEIGILKAIGCPSSSILMEFLLEAIFMGLAGGVLGVVLSFGIIPLIEIFGMRLETSLIGYLLALMFALLTATIFGFYPAYKASKLVPIEALTLN